jgi:predicted nucleic acid-binding protein
MNIRRGVLWDSSAILALLDADDDDHERAVAIASQIASERRPGFVTNYIEVEAYALLLRKLGRTLAREWLLTGGLPVIRALPPEFAFPPCGRFLRYVQTRQSFRLRFLYIR